ncbi:MAG: Dabb family protein [Spirochaetia bacterium]|nr:Dabb family protein [Spirochaetia bacterium]
MIKHIVMWKLKENAAGADKSKNAEKVIERITKLKGITPGMGVLEVGKDFNRSPNAFDLALYSEFDSMDALNDYQNHPDHVAVKDFLLEVTEERAVVDYEI